MSVCRLRSDTCGTRALSSDRLSDRPERCVNTPISSAVNSAFEPYNTHANSDYTLEAGPVKWVDLQAKVAG